MKKLGLALLAAAALVPAAQAQSAGDILARVRVVNVTPSTTTLPAGEVSFGNKVIPEIDLTYFVSANVAAELVLTYPQQFDAKLNGGQVGTLKLLPPTLTAQYHFTDWGAIKPYVGAGVNLTLFSGVDMPGLSVCKSSTGLAVQAGVDYKIDRQWSLNLDVKKVQIRTDLNAGSTNLGTVKVDPLLVGVGVGMKF